MFLIEEKSKFVLLIILLLLLSACATTGGFIVSNEKKIEVSHSYRGETVDVSFRIDRDVYELFPKQFGFNYSLNKPKGIRSVKGFTPYNRIDGYGIRYEIPEVDRSKKFINLRLELVLENGFSYIRPKVFFKDNTPLSGYVEKDNFKYLIRVTGISSPEDQLVHSFDIWNYKKAMIDYTRLKMNLSFNIFDSQTKIPLDNVEITLIPSNKNSKDTIEFLKQHINKNEWDSQLFNFLSNMKVESKEVTIKSNSNGEAYLKTKRKIDDYNRNWENFVLYTLSNKPLSLNVLIRKQGYHYYEGNILIDLKEYEYVKKYTVLLPSLATKINIVNKEDSNPVIFETKN